MKQYSSLRSIKNLLAILALVSTGVHAWQQVPARPLSECAAHMPYGIPQSKRPALQGLCRLGYATAVDNSARLPVWTSYVLTPANALGCLPRSNGFVTDHSVKNGARPDDYAGTGYDKGHVAPSGDMRWDRQAEFESFLMTNMMPQLAQVNRGIWKTLETTVRGLAIQRGHSHTIYAGPIYSSQSAQIGRGVVVPDGFYKIVINNHTREIAGWVFPHQLGPEQDLTAYRMPVAQIVKLAGIRFGLPKPNKQISPDHVFVVDHAAVSRARRDKCN